VQTNTIMPNGDVLTLSPSLMTISFTGERSVLSTSALNGGIKNNLTTVFNHSYNLLLEPKTPQMLGPTMEIHYSELARSLSLDPLTTTGFSTGVNIDNTAIISLPCQKYTVTALVTAGLEVNACRVGNPAPYQENDGVVENPPAGTINIVLSVDADMTEACLTRALVTVTAAKVAALQELLVSDRYHGGLATGSGTDGVIIIANSESPIKVHEAGEQFKLGEVIGQVVIKAVKEALFRHDGLSTQVQHSVLRRLERFGVTKDTIAQACKRNGFDCQDPDKLDEMFRKIDKDGYLVTLASLYAHLIDQVQWGLIVPSESIRVGEHLLNLMGFHNGFERIVFFKSENDNELLSRRMSAAFIDAAAFWMTQRNKV